MTDPIAQQNAALHLEGIVLDGDWTVGQINVPDPDATGGVFSVTYPVSRPDGQLGFLKVLNLGLALQSLNFIDTLQLLTGEYASERDLCIMVGEKKLSRVVIAVDHGEFILPGYTVGAVSYIIFELATHDVRVALAQGASINTVLKLQYVHNLALGLRQLHQNYVAHQDLKPSNFLVFPKTADGKGNGKIADLGRAFRRGAPSPHDQAAIPGDSGYAPPEQLFRYQYPDEATRRYAADLYQLGSLICFLFTGVTMNARLSTELAPQHHWRNYGDTYQTVLPYLNDAFARVMEGLGSELPAEIADELTGMIRYLCEPNAAERGHPASKRARYSPQFSLERVVAHVDMIGRRAAVAARLSK